MSLAHDIYNPPPAPPRWAPPQPEPIHWLASDVSILVALSGAVLVAAGLAARFDATLGLLILTGGALVIVESWITALGFLHQHRQPRFSCFRDRWRIFVAALFPWAVGLALATGLMLGLFALSDRWG